MVGEKYIEKVTEVTNAHDWLTQREEMRNMKKHTVCSIRRCLVSLPIALVVLVLTCYSAAADIYDDFNRNGIDVSKWAIIGGGFSQPGDGYLYYSGSGNTESMLGSKTFFTSGVFTLSFLDYRCDNDAPSDRGLGSIVGLLLGNKEDHVRIERGNVRYNASNPGGYIEVNWVVPGEAKMTHVSGIPSETKAGFIQIHYDGTRVICFYRASLTDSWIQVGPVLTPGWKKAKPLIIQANPGGTKFDRYNLSFKLDSLEITPMPVLEQGDPGGRPAGDVSK